MSGKNQYPAAQESPVQNVLGWERSVAKDRLSFKERMFLQYDELKAALISLAILSIIFMISCVLATNPFENTQRIASEVLNCNSWAGTNHWQIVWAVVGLAMIFEFLDSVAGMGYGTALTPLLLLMGYQPMQIIPVIMIQQGCAGILGAYIHKEYGNVEWCFSPLSETVKLIIIISGGGVLAVTFSISSIYAVLKLGEVWIKLYAVLLLLFMGGTALFGCKKASLYRPKRMYFFGALAGFNKGIGGGGYGPVVTIGGLLSGIPAKPMMAITAFSEGIVCITSVFVWFFWLSHGVIIDFVLLPSMILGSILAVVIAPYVTRVFPELLWRRFVPIYCCVLSGFCFWKLLPRLISLLL